MPVSAFFKLKLTLFTDMPRAIIIALFINQVNLGGKKMFYLIFTALFLKPSIRKEDIPSQIGRAISGFIISIVLLYFLKVDRSISFLISALWIPALVQVIFMLAGMSVKKFDRKKKGVEKTGDWRLVLVFICAILVSIVYNSYPYITGGAKKLAYMVNVTESKEMVSKIDTQHIIVISPGNRIL